MTRNFSTDEIDECLRASLLLDKTSKANKAPEHLKTQLEIREAGFCGTPGRAEGKNYCRKRGTKKVFWNDSCLTLQRMPNGTSFQYSICEDCAVKTIKHHSPNKLDVRDN